MQSLTTLLERMRAVVWDGDLRRMPWPKRLGLFSARLTLAIGRDLGAGELNLRAMSLVYTTLLSLVPLLALSFSVLKGFGVHNQLEPLLLGYLAPLGPKGVDLAQRIIEFVENIKVGVLGSVGLGLLIFTVISLLQKIETAFNFVWRAKRLRTLSERFSRFLSVLMVGPLLVFSAMGLTATVMNNTVVKDLIAIEPFGTLILGLGKLVPYLLVILAFTFIYTFIPNARVQTRPALVGGLIGGLLWQTTGWGFAAFIASSTKYAAIYSGFAIIILMLIWFYLSWLVLLLGAQVAFYVQNPAYMSRPAGPIALNERDHEGLALGLLYLVIERFERGQAPVPVELIERELAVPSELVDRSAGALIAAGILAETAGPAPGYLPALDPANLTLAEVVRRLRESGATRIWTNRLPPPAREAMRRIDQALDQGMGGLPVTALLSGENPDRTDAEGRRAGADAD